jgi:hypothetical protein
VRSSSAFSGLNLVIAAIFYWSSLCSTGSAAHLRKAPDIPESARICLRDAVRLRFDKGMSGQVLTAEDRAHRRGSRFTL